MTLREIDALVRENSLEMIGNDALNSRYVTSLNMLRAIAPGMSAGMLRLKPEEVKAGKQQIREPL